MVEHAAGIYQSSKERRKAQTNFMKDDYQTVLLHFQQLREVLYSAGTSTQFDAISALEAYQLANNPSFLQAVASGEYVVNNHYLAKELKKVADLDVSQISPKRQN